MTRRWLIALGCMTAMLVTAAAAGADSVAFIRDSNVWIANADGSGQFQVTLDGSAASPYESPSQADDGTILAIRQPPGQRNQLFRMTEAGALLNAPINTPAPGPAGAIDAKISPNGALVVYWFVTTVSDPICVFCVNVASSTLISRSDRFTTYNEVGTPNTGIQPSWITNSTILLSNSNGTQWTYTLGAPEGVEWFENSDTGFGDFKLLADGEVAPSGDRLALVRGDLGERLLVYKLNGAPPALPSAPACGFNTPSGKFVGPTWSTAGTRLYWQENDGIWSAPIPTATTCGTPALLIAGATMPDASPAALNPGARPGCGNPGNPALCTVTPPPCDSTTSCTQPPCIENCTPVVCKACSATAVRAVLKSLLSTGSKSFTKLKLSGVLKRRHVKLSFTAPQAGTLTASVTAGSTIASAKRVFKAAGKGTLDLVLTSKAAKRLRHVKRLQITLKAAFVAAPKGSKAVSATQTLTLR